MLERVFKKKSREWKVFRVEEILELVRELLKYSALEYSGCQITKGKKKSKKSQCLKYRRRRACVQVLFLSKTELGFFHCFRNSDSLCLLPSADQKIPMQPGWYLRQQKIPFAENRFLQTGFFRHVRELKIQRKNPGSALRIRRDRLQIPNKLCPWCTVLLDTSSALI